MRLIWRNGLRILLPLLATLSSACVSPTGPIAPTLSSIAVTSATPTLAVSATLSLTATGTYSDGSHADLTSQVSWRTSNSTVATVSNGGTVTGVATGGVTITATDPSEPSISGQLLLTVTNGSLTRLQPRSPA